jgi:hypothetical protein
VTIQKTSFMFWFFDIFIITKPVLKYNGSQ